MCVAAVQCEAAAAVYFLPVASVADTHECSVDMDGWFHVCFYNDFYYYLYYFYRVPIVLWVIKQYPINLAL